MLTPRSAPHKILSGLEDLLFCKANEAANGQVATTHEFSNYCIVL